MNKFRILLLLLSVVTTSSDVFSINLKNLTSQLDGLTEIGVTSMTDPQYEWSQFTNKTGRAVITANGLILESKSKEFMTSSVVELNFNPETDDFVFTTAFIGPKLSDGLSIGVIFDYVDARNYKGIELTKTQYKYFIVKDGVAADVKSGLIKFKDKTYNVAMSRKGEKLFFYLNDIEFAKFNRIKIDSPYIGVFLKGKGKTILPCFQFNIIEQEGDSEQSTTDK